MPSFGAFFKIIPTTLYVRTGIRTTIVTLQVSLLETKHLMEISDFDHDGKLSQHLGRKESWKTHSHLLRVEFFPERKGWKKRQFFWVNPPPKKKKNMGCLDGRWWILPFAIVGEAAGWFAHLESTGSHEQFFFGACYIMIFAQVMAGWVFCRRWC